MIGDISNVQRPHDELKNTNTHTSLLQLLIRSSKNRLKSPNDENVNPDFFLPKRFHEQKINLSINTNTAET